MVENSETLYDMLTESLEDALQAREEGRILKIDFLVRDNEFEWDEEMQWYYDAVVSDLIIRGKNRKEAIEIVETYRLRDRLLKYGGLQLHYSVEVAADEALDCYEGLKKEGE